MKTTVELPDRLAQRVKLTAAQRGTTFRNLVIEGLERVVESDDDAAARRKTALARVRKGFHSAVSRFHGRRRMNAEVFVDTNILVYSFDLDAGIKRQTALKIVEAGWRKPSKTAVSIQVLLELQVNLVRRGREVSESSEIVRDFFGWNVVENTVELLKDAMDAQMRWQISLWDALIVAAAVASGARELLTEDLNHGQDYGGVRVRNPFLPK